MKMVFTSEKYDFKGLSPMISLKEENKQKAVPEGKPYL